MPIKIVADENIPYVKEAFSALGEVVTQPGRSLCQKDLDDAELLLVRSVTPVNSDLLQGTNIRYVASATIGFDHLDIDYLRQKNIPWTTAPGCNAIAAAEYVTAAIFHAASKKGENLAGKTVGIIGCGNVGSAVQSRLSALGMQCMINDPPLQQQHPDGHYVTLDQALQADYITLHVPYTTLGEYPTRHLIHQENLPKIAPDAVLINAARGSVIHNQALLQHCKHHPQFQAILDVWEPEPAFNPELLEHCLLGSPHIAGYSLEGRVRGTQMIYRAVCEYFSCPADWNMAMALPDNKNWKIDLTTREPSENLVAIAIQQAYNIKDDDDSMREIASLPPAERGQQFDLLRKNYPLRREFSTFTVILDPAQASFRQPLIQLGFNVTDMA
ncbi:MAG TPA: 4-phosphoerythronate dehydrogenase [Gammaproteobacteria bacterium]|nr:4-phosphoerythronate dehydrogenase [Gammaproteobacteria bacterium]